MRDFKNIILIKIILSTSLFVSGFCCAASLAPPPYQVQNRHEVNMASGGVSPSQNDISIGGQMGLSHSISIYSNNFANVDGNGPNGYREKFYGCLYKAEHHLKSLLSNTDLYVIRVCDDSSTTDFLINADANTFTALKDPRYTLEFVNNPAYRAGFLGFVYTKADGTRVYYPSQTTNHNFTASNNPYTLSMDRIEYPNGLTYYITRKASTLNAPISSVTTNTGYQLKYIYVRVSGTYQAPTSDLPAGDSVSWSANLPKHVSAINNAIDYCTPSANDYTQLPSQACTNMSKSWPQVTYEWPINMPRAMYLGASSFKVIDSGNKVTEYQHTPYYVLPESVRGSNESKIPRLTAIKYPTGKIINYDYKSEVESTQGSTWNFTWYMVGGPAKLVRSWVDNDSIGYSIGVSGQYNGFTTNGSGGYKPVSVSSYALTGPKTVTSWDQTVNLSIDYANRVTTIDKTLGGGTITFGYDGRGNVTSRNEDGIVTLANYLPTCDSSNFKYCNQATWMKDANGKETNYTYHALSGQVATVTGPADKNGIRPQTRYTYEQKYAMYKDAAGTLIRAPSPIWLLTKESKCLAGAANSASTGCANGPDDEVVTTYGYGPASGANNLLLRSVRVAIKSESNSRLTCYAYDDLGNRIGETKPRAGLFACP